MLRIRKRIETGTDGDETSGLDRLHRLSAGHEGCDFGRHPLPYGLSADLGLDSGDHFYLIADVERTLDQRSSQDSSLEVLGRGTGRVDVE